MKSEQVSLESFAEDPDWICCPDIGRSSFHHWGARTERSCDFAEPPLFAFSNGVTSRPADVVEHSAHARGSWSDQCWEVDGCSSIVGLEGQRSEYAATVLSQRWSSWLAGVATWSWTWTKPRRSLSTSGRSSLAKPWNVRREVRTAEKITGTSIPSIQDIAPKCCMSRAGNIIRDPSHPHHGLFFFSLLASGKRFCSKIC